MEIAPDKQNIDSLFSNTNYYIDFYQRDYKWTEEPVKRLLDDIFFKFNQEYEINKSLEPSPATINNKYSWYYLNTYVTNKIDGKVYVVDGQQRLTTLTLILIKLYHKAKEFEPDGTMVEWVKQKIAGVSGSGYSFWMNHEFSKNVLEDLFDNKKELKSIDTNRSITSVNLVNNFKAISKYLDYELIDLHRLKAFTNYFLYRIVLINLDVQQTEVPMVFEVINDRGVRLKPYEILKGKLLGQINKSELDDFKFNDLWENNVNLINKFKDDEIDNFFRYYLKAKYSNTRKEGTLFDGDYHRTIFANDMNKILKLNHNPMGVKEFLKTSFSYYTRLFSKILKAYSKKDDKYPSVIYNKLNDMDGQFMMILSSCKLEDPQEDDKIEKVAYEIDRLFSLLQLQNSYDSNSFYEILFSISQEIRDGELNIRPIFDKYLFKELGNKKNLEINEPIEYAFFKNTGIGLNLRFKRYYFARVEEFLSKNLGNDMMKHSLENLVTKTGIETGFHIEHILAHNDENKALFNNDKDLFEQERNRLGGLLILRGKDDHGSRNETYEKKLKTYSSTLFWNETLIEDTYANNSKLKELKEKFNLDLVPHNSFGPLELERRHKLLFEITKLIWS